MPKTRGLRFRLGFLVTFWVFKCSHVMKRHKRRKNECGNLTFLAVTRSASHDFQNALKITIQYNTIHILYMCVCVCVCPPHVNLYVYTVYIYIYMYIYMCIYNIYKINGEEDGLKQLNTSPTPFWHEISITLLVLQFLFHFCLFMFFTVSADKSELLRGSWRRHEAGPSLLVQTRSVRSAVGEWGWSRRDAG